MAIVDMEIKSYFLVAVILTLGWAQKCERKIRNPTAEKFFKYSLRDSENYLEPTELNYFCRKNFEEGFCIFPQDLRSQSYYRNKSSTISAYYAFFHPYVEDYQEVNNPKVELGTKYDETFYCGTVKKDYVITTENRHRAPQTMMVEAGDVGAEFFTAIRYDVEVNKNGFCLPYPCPLAIRIYSPDFNDTSFNGYYVLNYPAKIDGGFLREQSPAYIPSYRHLSRNLYLFADFTELGADGRATYRISHTPFSRNCEKNALKFVVEHPMTITLGSMGQRYCFSQATFIGAFYEEKSNSHNIKRYDVRPLTKQCGLTFRGSENTLLGTGMQPFVVDVNVNGVKCVGTLITPMHILTLATCFTIDKDYFDLEANVVNRCGVKKGWKSCPRWFSLNKEINGRDAVLVTTFESVHEVKVKLPVAWFEIHPLFDGQEFDLAILALKSYVQRNINLHPICLPKWNLVDIMGNPTNDRLYRPIQWENYQMLHSLKAVQKDVRFYTAWTDVNGPSKFQKCTLSDKGDEGTTNWKEFCHIKDYKPPPRLFYDREITGDLYNNEDPKDYKNNDGTTKSTCEYFYHLLEKEESNFKLRSMERQIRHLRDNTVECFAEVTMEFLDESQKSLKCYERRRKCLKHRGWCYTDQEYGYCSELNEIPDTPDPVQPLMEIQTFILPKETCKNVPQLVQSESRICTGHVTRGPSEYIFQVSQQAVKVGSRMIKKAVYEVVEFIGGLQRPMVKTPDAKGRMRLVTSALEGTCHGPGTPSDYDKGAPTYFRYPIETSGGGQHSHPGTAYAVLYSLQRNAGKFCDFKSYTDTEVLVAMTDVMEWIEVVSMEINGTKQSIFDIEYSKVALDLQAMRVTTTQQTTELLKTTTKFADVWANKGLFKETIKETEKANPGFSFHYKRHGRLVTKPPFIFIENYDWSESKSSRNVFSLSFLLIVLFAIIQ